MYVINSFVDHPQNIFLRSKLFLDAHIFLIQSVIVCYSKQGLDLKLTEKYHRVTYTHGTAVRGAPIFIYTPARTGPASITV